MKKDLSVWYSNIEVINSGKDLCLGNEIQKWK